MQTPKKAVIWLDDLQAVQLKSQVPKTGLNLLERWEDHGTAQVWRSWYCTTCGQDSSAHTALVEKISAVHACYLERPKRQSDRCTAHNTRMQAIEFPLLYLMRARYAPSIIPRLLTRPLWVRCMRVDPCATLLRRSRLVLLCRRTLAILRMIRSLKQCRDPGKQ